jgi:hypothetical protein
LLGNSPLPTGRGARALAWAAAAALAAQLPTALAQEVPLGFSIGPGETVTYDSNVLRLPGNTPAPGGRSDVSSLTSLTGTLHENYGREDINLSATVGRVFYKRLTNLDYTEQDLRGALKASLPLSIEANLGASHSATLAHFADLSTTARNIITRNTANADLDLPVYTDFRAVAGAQGSQSRNSNDLFRTQDFNSSEGHGGIRYQPTTGNHVDLLVRSVTGTYTNGSPASYVGSGYRNRGADLSADWTFSGASHLHGRAGYLKHTGDDHLFPVLDAFGFPVSPARSVEINRNFAGPAFDLTYSWQLTALTSVRIFGLRESGGAGDNNYQSAVTHTYRVTPTYQPTVKTTLGAYAEWSKRDYFTNVLVGTAQFNGTQRLDRLHSFGVTALWNPRRWVQGSVDVHHEVRDSNVAVGVFDDTVASLQIQGTF